MASSNSDAQLSTGGAEGLLLPWVLGLPALNDSDPREIAIFLHQPSRSITLVEGAIDDETVLRETSSNDDSFPATKASIQSLSYVQVSESGLECAICLSEYEINVEAAVKEMPCRHKFHSNCIERWLGIHGSCPICRFRMPKELRKLITEREGWRIHTFYGGPEDLISNPLSETNTDTGHDESGTREGYSITDGLMDI